MYHSRVKRFLRRSFFCVVASFVSFALIAGNRAHSLRCSSFPMPTRFVGLVMGSPKERIRHKKEKGRVRFLRFNRITPKPQIAKHPRRARPAKHALSGVSNQHSIHGGSRGCMKSTVFEERSEGSLSVKAKSGQRLYAVRSYDMIRDCCIVLCSSLFFQYSMSFSVTQISS